MSTPRGCSYNQHRCHEEKNIPLGEPVNPMINAKGASYRPMPVEMRGITLRQLRAIYANAARRCNEEGWVNYKGKLVTPETVTLYDVDKYIVKPFTKDTQASFVETLPSTSGTQPPRIFMSHWWNMPLKDTIICLEQMYEDFKWNRNEDDDARGGGMSEDTPIWICAFAHNQWRLDEYIMTKDPSQHEFARAMETSNYRTVTICESNLIVFERIWSFFEIFLTLTKPNGVWAVYTPCNHSISSYRKQRDAIGIVLGGAPGEAADDTYIREESFPRELLVKTRDLRVENADASWDKDRRVILNYMSGNEENLEAEPPTIHDTYDKLNNAVKGAFAASIPALKAALATGEVDEWKEILTILSKGLQTNTFTLDFSAFDTPLSSKQAYELISHVPVTCKGLLLTNAFGETIVGVARGVIEWVQKANKVKEIIFFNCRVGDSEMGQRIGSQLMNGLTNNNCVHTIKHLYMTNTDLVVSRNISDWAPLVFKKMTNMKLFYVIKNMNQTLATLSKGRQTQTFKVDFSAYDHPLSSTQAYDLVSHIPITCTHLHLSNATDSETMAGAIGGMVEWMRNAREIKELIFDDCNVGDGRVIGSQLANELTESSCTAAIEYFHMTNTDLVVPGNKSEWTLALRQMKSLIEFKCLGRVAMSKDDVNIARKAARDGAFVCIGEK